MRGSGLRGQGQRSRPPAHGDHLVTAADGFADVQQPDRTNADDGHPHPGDRPQAPPSVHDAGQRLEERGLDVGQGRGLGKQVPPNDARREARRLTIGPDGDVVEQCLAQVLAAPAARPAPAARRGGHEDDRLAHRESPNLFADGGNVPGGFVAEGTEG